jgi:IS6 family transposase
MMSERGLKMAHTTILRWEQHDSPVFERRRKRYARSVGGSWRIVQLIGDRKFMFLPIKDNEWGGPLR